MLKNSMDTICGCFPTGRHYPGIAAALETVEISVVGLSASFSHDVIWKDTPLVVIDFETTGLKAEEDRVLEVGLVCIDGGLVTESKNWLVNPAMPVPEASRAVHGITDEELRDAPFFAGIAQEMHALLQGRIPVAYNAGFDRGFLKAEFARLSNAPSGEAPPALDDAVTWIDPLVWVRELQKYEKGKKLTDVCARMGIALTQAHRAAGDAEAAGRVLLALAKDLPTRYGELIRLQIQYAARQEAELSAWRKRKG